MQTTSRKQLLKKLLTTFHLDIVERKEFVDNPIRKKEIFEIIQEELDVHTIFPKEVLRNSDHDPVFEGHFIEKTIDNKFKIRCQRSQALNPFLISEESAVEYLEFETAVEEYIKKEFAYNIDGLKITR